MQAALPHASNVARFLIAVAIKGGLRGISYALCFKSFHDLGGGALELLVRFRGARRCAVCVDESAIASVRLTSTVGVPAISTGKEVALPVCIVSEAQRTSELRPVGRPLCVR